MSFETKDSGKRVEFSSGMVRDDAVGKTDFDLLFNGPMYDRWAELLTRGEVKYPPDADGMANWLKAEGEAELRRFRKSASRHFRQWRRGDTDEDHAAAIFFNVNGYEYVKGKLEWPGDEVNDENQAALHAQISNEADFFQAGAKHARETQQFFASKAEVDTFHGIPIEEPVDLDKMFPSNDYEGEPVTFKGHPIQWVPDLSKPYLDVEDGAIVAKCCCDPSVMPYCDACRPIYGVDPASPQGDRSYIRVVALDPKLQGAADALTTVLNANLCQPEKKVEYGPLIQKARDAAYAELWSDLEKSMWGIPKGLYASRTDPQDFVQPTRWQRFKAWLGRVKESILPSPQNNYDDCAW